MMMGGIAVGVAVAMLWAMAACGRRRRLRRGEIGELAGLWRTVGGCRVFARVSDAAGGVESSRVPVVLVHGLGVSGAYFVPTAERLATEFSVYVPDLPGHGRSDTPGEPMDIPRLAGTLVDWMDAVGLDRAALVGNSMGCQIIVEAALRFPDRIDRLVLIDPNSDPSARTAIRHVWRLLLDVPFERPTLIPVVMADYLRVGLRLFSELRFMLRDRMEDKLPSITVPTMLVRGEHDPICPRRWFERAAGLIRAECVAVIPWWGHAVNFSAPGRLVGAISPFLRAGGDKARRLNATETPGNEADDRRGLPGRFDSGHHQDRRPSLAR